MIVLRLVFLADMDVRHRTTQQRRPADKREYDRQWWLKIKQNPQRYAQKLEANRENSRKFRLRRKLKHLEYASFPIWHTWKLFAVTDSKDWESIWHLSVLCTRQHAQHGKVRKKKKRGASGGHTMGNERTVCICRCKCGVLYTVAA